MFGRNSQMIGFPAASPGQLDPSLYLLSETQASVRGVRFGNEGIVDCLGGLELEQERLAPLSDNFAEELWAKIDTYEVSQARARDAAKAAGNALQELLDLPQPLREICLESAGRFGWTFAGPGVKYLPLDTGGKLPAKLLRIEPGFGAPNHDHTGTEYTLVVKGAFEDGLGHYGPGDLSIKRAGQIHHPIAQSGEICFALAVEEGDVAFTGALGVLQRLFTRH
jgi:putative transcriptional regulator